MFDSQLSIGHFTCVKSFDGLTLFSRSIPNSIQIPYRIVETLNTILTIGDKFGLRLHSIDSHELKIVWKIYHANITLILIEESSAHSEQVSFRKLDLLFDALVFMYGLEDLLNIQNVEKFKLDIKIAYPLIDAILRGEHFDLFGGYLANLFDLVIVNDVRRYQALLDSTCQSISSYACLFLNGKIVAATAAWLELKSVESYLISLLCLSLDSPNCRDIPVYLPHKNPHQPLRLLTYSLTCDNLTLCFICSEKPKVDLIESMIYKIWHPQYKELLELRDLYPRNLPSNISTDQNMISFLLINKVTNCCTASLLPNEKVNFNLSKAKLKAKYDLLKKCYLLISSLYFNKSDVKRNNDESNLKKTDVLEAYIEMNGFKCFALNDIVFEFYALYKKDIPTYALRGVTKTCYAILTKLH